jgi:glycosyltransferase involved in cell wall biosynthesis
MPHRRLEDAIEALAQLKHKGVKVRLLLAGSGDAHPDYFRFLKDQVQKLGLQEEVTFAGKVEDGEIRDYYCACNAFVFPNEFQTWGLAVLEAMACGCPVLVSEGAAVHEILTDNETAVLFPARQPEALAAKIEMLVIHPELKRGIAEAGMRLVRTNYNWERFAEQMEQVFRSAESAAAMQETYVPATDR